MATISVLGFISFIYWKGGNDTKNRLITQDLKQTIELERQYEEKKQEVIQLDRSDLHERYCEWMRDSKQMCLEADLPIP